MTIDMNKQIAIASDIKQGLANFNDEDTKKYFIEKYAPDATDIELAEFIATAQSDEAVPGRDIYFIKFKNKKDGGFYPATFVHSIHWMTRKAHESGDFVGFTDPEYLDSDGVWHKTFWPYDPNKHVPVACKIGVIKKSTDKIGWSTVRWDEKAFNPAGYVKKQYKEQPIHMITKCAKTQGYRDAGFVGARYIAEEMPEPAENGIWENPDAPVGEQVKDITQRVSDRKRARTGDVRDNDDLKVDANDTAKLDLCFKDLGITKVKDYISWCNEVLKGLDEPVSIKKKADLTKGQCAILLEAAAEEIKGSQEQDDEQDFFVDKKEDEK